MASDYSDEAGSKMIDDFMRFGERMGERAMYARAAQMQKTFRNATRAAHEAAGADRVADEEPSEWAKLDMHEFRGIEGYDTIKEIIEDMIQVPRRHPAPRGSGSFSRLTARAGSWSFPSFRPPSVLSARPLWARLVARVPHGGGAPRKEGERNPSGLEFSGGDGRWHTLLKSFRGHERGRRCRANARTQGDRGRRRGQGD